MKPQGVSRDLAERVAELARAGDAAELAELLRSLDAPRIAALTDTLDADTRPLVLRVLVEFVAKMARGGASAEITALLDELHPEDVADHVERLDVEDRLALMSALPSDAAGEVLLDLDNQVRGDLLDRLHPGVVTELVEQMEAADAADVVGDLTDATAAVVLESLPAADAAEVRGLLEYPTDSAGGVMSTEFVAIRAAETVAEAVQHIRARAEELGDFYYVYVVDGEGHLAGVCSLKGLLLAEPQQRIAELLIPEPISVLASADQEEAANLAIRYQLFALPVVDERSVLVGQIKLDDFSDIVEEEVSEDMYRMVGLPEDESVFSPLRFSVRKRLPWLFVNLATAMMAASVVGLFTSTLERLVILATMMPIVAGMGGNAGMQTLTIIVRGMALGEVDVRNSWRALAKELAVGLINGIAVGIAVALVAWRLSAKPWLGAVIGTALVLNMMAAGIAGALVPVVLRALRVDPALASGVIVTTVTDCLGFFFFLGLASALLPLLV